MKKRFIILIDFSEYSANLIKYAYDWSKQVNAELLIVHKTVILAPALADDESKESIAKYTNAEAMEKLKDLGNSILPSTARVSYYVSESHLLLTITKLLSEPFQNLIFVGLKGTGLLKKIFIGSVAIQVIEKSNNIVVAMPKEVSKFSPEKFFVAVSEKYPLNILALENFLDFVGKGVENITFFSLTKPDEKEKRKQIEKQLKDLSQLVAQEFNTSIAIYEGNSSFEDIKKVISNKIEEILIVQKGSRFLTDQIFRKFLINELVYEGKTPMIVLP